MFFIQSICPSVTVIRFLWCIWIHVCVLLLTWRQLKILIKLQVILFYRSFISSIKIHTGRNPLWGYYSKNQIYTHTSFQSSWSLKWNIVKKTYIIFLYEGLLQNIFGLVITLTEYIKLVSNWCRIDFFE